METIGVKCTNVGAMAMAVVILEVVVTVSVAVIAFCVEVGCVVVVGLVGVS